MAELKPLKITIEGVDKVLKSTQQIQKELNEVKRLAKEKNNITLNDTQAREVLRNLKKQAQDAEASLQSIDKNVKFANFKAAMKSISSEIVSLAAVAATSGKSVSENINSIGGSIAGIASNFGIVGAAAGAAITLITPFIASLFEVSEAEKAVGAATEEASKQIGKELAVLEGSFDTLRSATSNYSERKEAIADLQKLLPGYFDDLSAEKNTVEQLNRAYLIGNTLIRERAIKQAFLSQKQEQFNRLANIELERQRAFDKTTAGAAGAQARNDANAIYLKALSQINQNLRQIEIAEENALAGVQNKLTVEEQITIEKAKQAKSQKEQNEDEDKARKKRDAERKQNAAAAKAKKDANEKADLKPLSDNVDQALSDLNASIADPTTSIESLNNELGRVNVLIDNYLNSLGDLSDEAKIAADEIAAIGVELANNATTEFEAAKQRQSELGTVLELISKGFTQDNLGNVILGTPQQTLADLARIKKVGKAIADLALQGKISAEEARQRFAKEGITLGFVESQEKIINDVQERNSKLKGRISELNRKIEKESAEEELKIRDDLNAKRLAAEKKIAERQRLAIENIYKRVSEQTGETGAAELAAGKQKFDKFVDDIENSYQDKLKAVTEKNKGALQAGNSLVPNLFKFDDDAIIINEKAYVAALATLSNEDATAAANAIQLAKETNRELSAINIQKNAEIFNANIEYINRLSQSYKTLNAAELEELRIFLNRQKILNEDAQAQTLSSISKTVKARRELGKKQSAEELQRINTEEQKALIALNSYFDADTKLRTGELQKKIELGKEGGSDTTLFEEELTNELLRIQIEREKAVNKVIAEYAALRDKQLKKANDTRLAQTIVKDLQGFGNAFVDFLNQQSQNLIDSLTEDLTILEAKQTDVLSNIARLEDDLEGKRSGRRDAVLQALEQQRSLEEQVAKDKLALMERIEKEEIKMRKRQQAASIANAVINGALAITNILAQPSIIPEPANSIFKAVQIGLSVGTTAAQVATIASQKFAKGGFTGAGSERDETGHKVAGVVHNDEWVAPKWMVESPKFGGVINQLENARTKGFAQGGFTSPDFNSLSQSVSSNSTAKLESMMRSYMETNIELANRPVFVSATEVQNVNTTSSRRRASVTL